MIGYIIILIMSKKLKTIEDRYKKTDLHKHILNKPGMYVGYIKSQTSNMLVYNENREDTDPELIFKDIKYVPGLYKIFDEILVNARDHVIRSTEEKSMETCTMIKVEIDKKTGLISVWNNGQGIPVVVHKEYKIMVPSLIFGELLTSENYDDTDERKVGGTNGLGAKLTNIYSSAFEIETIDSSVKKKFYQKFSNNMYDKTEPKIISAGAKKSYTKISFIPDFVKFGIKKLSADIIALFKKRTYDIASTCSAKVYYNGEIISNNSFPKYVDSCFPSESEYVKVMDVSNPDWQISVVYDPDDKLGHKNISFVNGISTSRGGSHVDYIVDQIVKKIRDSVSKKVKTLDVKPHMIKENLIFFISAVIINPEFDNQTKEYLTTKVADFGSTYIAPDSFLKRIIKTGVVDQIILHAKAKADARLANTTRGKNTCSLDYQKLFDASHASRKKGDCTLILTEGDSAKTFALSGLNVIGREKYGVFPLKGKLMNVRNFSPLKVSENDEIAAITKIVGLEYKKEYTSTKGLRYGSILILTDQDLDGFHIKGLIINFIHYYWPSLAKYEGFIRYLATPLIRITKNGKKNSALEFYSPQEYQKWLTANNDGKGYTIKYYKGLGTHTSEDAQKCFTGIDKKIVSFFWKKKK